MPHSTALGGCSHPVFSWPRWVGAGPCSPREGSLPLQWGGGALPLPSHGIACSELVRGIQPRSLLTSPLGSPGIPNKHRIPHRPVMRTSVPPPPAFQLHPTYIRRLLTAAAWFYLEQPRSSSLAVDLSVRRSSVHRMQQGRGKGCWHVPASPLQRATMLLLCSPEISG